MPLARIMAAWYSRLMSTYLEAQIALRRARLLELDREKITVEAELRAYEDAHIHQDVVLTESKSASEGSPSGSFQMKPGWINILRSLAVSGKSFSAEDMVKASEAVGSPTTLPNARGQIFQYSKRGIIRRVHKGKYVLAKKGNDLIRNNEGPPAAASEPS